MMAGNLLVVGILLCTTCWAQQQNFGQQQGQQFPPPPNGQQGQQGIIRFGPPPRGGPPPFGRGPPPNGQFGPPPQNGQFGQGQGQGGTQTNSGQQFGVFPPQGQFGSNQGQFGTNQGQFGTSQGQFGTSQGQFGTSQGQFGTSQGQFGTFGGQGQQGQGQFGPPPFSGQQGQFGSQNGQFGTNNQGQGQFGPPPFGGQQGQFGGQQGQFGGQQGQFGGQNQNGQFGIQGPTGQGQNIGGQYGNYGNQLPPGQIGVNNGMGVNSGGGRISNQNSPNLPGTLAEYMTGLNKDILMDGNGKSTNCKRTQFMSSKLGTQRQAALDSLLYRARQAIGVQGFGQGSCTQERQGPPPGQGGMMGPPPFSNGGYNAQQGGGYPQQTFNGFTGRRKRQAQGQYTFTYGGNQQQGQYGQPPQQGIIRTQQQDIGNCETAGDNSPRLPSLYGEENVTLTDGTNGLMIVTNGIPDHCYQHDQDGHNPNQACEHFRVMFIPKGAGNYGRQPGDVMTDFPMGPVGIAKSGGYLYNHLSAEADCQVAAIQEKPTFDPCDGHADPQCRYHYHKGSSINYLTFTRKLASPAPNCIPGYNRCQLMGHMQDGMPVYGMCGLYLNNANTATQLKSCYVKTQGRNGCAPSHYTYPANGETGRCHLDKANGYRFTTRTRSDGGPTFEAGTYAYFFTPEYPFIMPGYYGKMKSQVKWCVINPQQSTQNTFQNNVFG